MGARGPAPKPSNLRVMQGNPSRRPLNRREPQPSKPKALPVPAILRADKRAYQIWKEVSPELRHCGLLTALDPYVFALFCKAWATFWEAQDFVDKHGQMFVMRDPPVDRNDPEDKGRIKYLQQYPQVAIAAKYLQIAGTYADRLGLSPAARSRIQLPMVEQSSDKDEARIFGS
jgi:P27 family predicted phage terminase small subunit